MRVPAQRRALGALFFLLAALFAGIAVAGATARAAAGWVIAAAAAALAVWMLNMAFRAWR